MSIWLDNHLSPAVARWIEARFSIPCAAIRDLGLARADDADIFAAARTANVSLITKDGDFVALVDRLGPPPRIIWLTCGNTSTSVLCGLLETRLPMALELLDGGEALVEIG